MQSRVARVSLTGLPRACSCFRRSLGGPNDCTLAASRHSGASEGCGPFRAMASATRREGEGIVTSQGAGRLFQVEGVGGRQPDSCQERRAIKAKRSGRVCTSDPVKIQESCPATCASSVIL